MLRAVVRYSPVYSWRTWVLVHSRFTEVEAVKVARHREVRQPQLVLIRARLSVGDFSLQELREPACRGELFLAQGSQAVVQRARHATQA